MFCFSSNNYDIFQIFEYLICFKEQYVLIVNLMHCVGLLIYDLLIGFCCFCTHKWNKLFFFLINCFENVVLFFLLKGFCSNGFKIILQSLVMRINHQMWLIEQAMSKNINLCFEMNKTFNNILQTTLQYYKLMPHACTQKCIMTNYIVQLTTMTCRSQ